MATAISMALGESKQVTLRGVGAGAVNQAVKACAIARGIVAPHAHDLVVRPGFRVIDGREGKITSVVLVVSLV